MAAAMAAHFPAGCNQFFDLSGGHITIGAHVISHNIGHTGQTIFLHDGEGRRLNADVAIIKGDDDRAWRQVGACLDGFDQQFDRDHRILPIMQQFHLRFELLRQDVILAVDWRHADAVIKQNGHNDRVRSLRYPGGRRGG